MKETICGLRLRSRRSSMVICTGWKSESDPMLVAGNAKPNAVRSSTLNWAEYGIEAACLGVFMISACSFGALLGHPDSLVVHLVQNPTLLRVMMGLAMG